MIKDKLELFNLQNSFTNDELDKLQDIANKLFYFMPEEDVEYRLLNLIAVMMEMDK